MAHDKLTNDDGMGAIFAVLLLIVAVCGCLFFTADYLEKRPVQLAAHDTSAETRL